MEKAVLFFDIDGTILAKDEDDTGKCCDSAADGEKSRASALYQYRKDDLQHTG